MQPELALPFPSLPTGKKKKKGVRRQLVLHEKDNRFGLGFLCLLS